MRVSQFICWDKETKKSQFQSNLCKKVSLKCEHNFLTNSIHYLNGMSSQVSQLVHDVGQDPAQQLVDNHQHGDHGDETCFVDLPGRQQSCLHPGPAAQAPPAFQFIFCQKERRKARWLFNPDLPLDERHLAFNKTLSLAAAFPAS